MCQTFMLNIECIIPYTYVIIFIYSVLIFIGINTIYYEYGKCHSSHLTIKCKYIYLTYWNSNIKICHRNWCEYLLSIVCNFKRFYDGGSQVLLLLLLIIRWFGNCRLFHQWYSISTNLHFLIYSSMIQMKLHRRTILC